MTEHTQTCPCCSGMLYEECCKPLHDGNPAENASKLMRSRYSAYCLNMPDYLMATTHPASRNYSDNKFSWKRQISQFARSTTFEKLEVLDFKENLPLATVTFTAYISQDGHDLTYTERSYFEKIDDQWFYLHGLMAEGREPGLINDSLNVLPLAYYGNPILRKQAEPILEITDDIHQLVARMIETMDANSGIGLAAPQVHHSIQLFVMRTPVDMEAEKRKLGDVQVFLNPIITHPSTENWSIPEGCLSIPGYRASVERPVEITVDYTTLDGQQIKKSFSGWEAKVILHETDHLNGVLFIDRLNNEERLKLSPFLNSLESRLKGVNNGY